MIKNGIVAIRLTIELINCPTIFSEASILTLIASKKTIGLSAFSFIDSFSL